MSKNDEGTTGGSVVGFQMPMGVKKRKDKLDDMLKKHAGEIDERHVLLYFKDMSDKEIERDCKDLDEGNYEPVVSRMKEKIVREIVRGRVKEIVRKKPGGGGYVLYSPNKGKKNNAKAVGSFPTKLGAKRAELARFPPKDPSKLGRLRKSVDKMLKDPKKAAVAARKDAEAKPKGAKRIKGRRPHREGMELLKTAIFRAVNESLFHEEKVGSDWDETIGRLSKQAVQGDSKFQGMQKNIQKKSESVLENAFNVISKNVDRKTVKLKNFGVKKAEDGKTYLAFSATIDNVEAAPIYIYIEGGTPKIEVSDQAKVALTKADPAHAKLFRAELVTVQERILDKMDELEKAIAARDKYLTKLEDEVDSFVADLSPLQVSLLKSLLVKKYRKIS